MAKVIHQAADWLDRRAIQHGDVRVITPEQIQRASDIFGVSRLDLARLDDDDWAIDPVGHGDKRFFITRRSLG